MSRVIKFRIWEKEKLRYYPSYVDIDNPDADFNKYTYDLATTGEITRTNYLDDCEVWAQTETYNASSEVEIEIFTGLKDKNGKEIYEGDIVEQFVCGVHQFKGKECGRKTLWQVRWNEEECCFELHYLSGSLFGDSMMSNSDEYEVIGNIHENPELLESEE